MCRAVLGHAFDLDHTGPGEPAGAADQVDALAGQILLLPGVGVVRDHDVAVGQRLPHVDARRLSTEAATNAVTAWPDVAPASTAAKSAGQLANPSSRAINSCAAARLTALCGAAGWWRTRRARAAAGSVAHLLGVAAVLCHLT
jgi:hypothetical protein